MPQIDLEPKDYRAEPVKGEPVFMPGAGRRVVIGALILLAGLAASVLTYPVYWLSCTFLTHTC